MNNFGIIAHGINRHVDKGGQCHVQAADTVIDIDQICHSSRSATGPKIVFVIPGLNVGGAERHTTDLRERLAEGGFNTSLIVHGWKRSQALLMSPGAKDAIFLDLKGMSDLFGWFRLLRELYRQKPDIVFAINQTPLIVSIVTRLLIRLPMKIACIFHTTTLVENEKRMLSLFRWALRLADVLIYVSTNQMTYWTQQGLRSQKTIVIRNGINLDHFKPMPLERTRIRNTYGIKPEEFLIGLVAAFRPEKDHAALINLLPRLRERGLPAKVLLVGDGLTRQNIERLAVKNGVADAVTFVGEQSDVRPFMAACDVGVLCSAMETMPLAAMEFLAMNIPMVISNVGGVSEIFRDGIDGFSFDPQNSEAFLQAMLRMASKIKVGIPFSLRDDCNKISMARMFDQYAQLIESLTASNCSGRI